MWRRSYLPQVLVGLAVTREGIPIRAWAWPGHTGDSELIGQAKNDLRGWGRSRAVWVGGRRLTSETNRRYLQRAGGHYILADELRAGSAEATTALARQARYRQVAGSDELTPTRRAGLRGELRTKPGLHRHLRVANGGLLRIDRAAINAEVKLDGTYLPATSDPSLTAEDVAAGYTQLAEVGAGWREMTHTLDLRPVSHRLADRIRAHVALF